MRKQYTAERHFTGGVEVWSSNGKLFIRVPVENDHPTQIEIDILEKTYDVYGYD